MPVSVMRLGLALLVGVPLLGAALAASPPPAPPSPVPPDTVQSTVSAGAPLVRPLPTSLGNAPVARYTVLKGPALSGAAGYSFTWLTRDTAPGTYAIALRADHPDAAPDTLIVQVTLQSE